MKRSIFILLFLTFLTSFSQKKNTQKVGKIWYDNFKPNKKEFYEEFTRLLDSCRGTIYTDRWFDFHTKIDSMGSLACEHHNKYMMEMSPEYSSKMFLGHEEKMVGCRQTIRERDNQPNELLTDTFKYRGNDTLINSFGKRCEYFSNKKFISYGECCKAGWLRTCPKNNYNSKDFAKDVLMSFKNSKPHWKILTEYFYTDIAIDLLVDKDMDRYWVTINTGRNPKTEYKYMLNDPRKKDKEKNKQNKKSFLSKIKVIFK